MNRVKVAAVPGGVAACCAMLLPLLAAVREILAARVGEQLKRVVEVWK